MAMTSDGKIATANREVSSFGSARDREHLLELRAQADAVMAGARTVDSNQVNMGPGGPRFRQMRVRNGFAEYNIRIIVSRTASIRPDAHIFAKRFSPIIVLTTEAAGKARVKKLQSLADHVEICGDRQIDWERTMQWLRKEWNIRRLLCEGGGELNDVLFRNGFVDELHLTIAPFVFGGRAAPTIADGQGAKTLSGAAKLQLRSMQKEGNELFLRFDRAAVAG